MTITTSLLNTIAPPDTLMRTTEANAMQTHAEATCITAFIMAAMIATEMATIDFAAGELAAAATAFAV